MEKLDYKQIMSVLQEELDGVSDFAYGEFGEHKFPEAKYNTPEYKEMTHEKLGDFEEVVQHGGEDQGSEWYVVFYFKDHDVYIRCDGYYSSYNGTDFDDGWDCCSQVIPTQKTITVYE